MYIVAENGYYYSLVAGVDEALGALKSLKN